MKLNILIAKLVVFALISCNNTPVESQTQVQNFDNDTEADEKMHQTRILWQDKREENLEPYHRHYHDWEELVAQSKDSLASYGADVNVNRKERVVGMESILSEINQKLDRAEGVLPEDWSDYQSEVDSMFFELHLVYYQLH